MALQSHLWSYFISQGSEHSSSNKFSAIFHKGWNKHSSSGLDKKRGSLVVDKEVLPLLEAKLVAFPKRENFLIAVRDATARKFLSGVCLLGHDTLLDFHSQKDRWISPQQGEDGSKPINNVHINIQGWFDVIPIILVDVVDLSVNPVKRFGNQQMLEHNCQDQVEDRPGGIESNLR